MMIDFHHCQLRKGARRHAVNRVRHNARYGKKLTRLFVRTFDNHLNISTSIEIFVEI